MIKDQNNNTTTYGYDDFGRMTKLTYANNSFLKNEYDLNSNVIRVTNPAGQVIEYDYDNLNRVTAKRFPATAALNSTLTYDPGSRLKTAITPNVSLSWTYDNLDRIKTVAQVVGGFSYTTGYSYDKAGNRIQLQYPSGKLVDYTFDNNNRPDLIKVNTVKLADYNFDPLSRRQNRTVFTGTNQFQTVYSFDLANQLKSLTNNVLPNTLLSQYSYPLYDKVGNRKSMTRKLATFSQTLDYTYNNIDEITAVSGSVTQSFNYDNVNNRTLANGVSYVPNNLNQYTAVGGVTYAYDTNGNLTSNGANTYTYDEENRLKSVTNTTNTASYGYDAFNRRISKTVNGVTTNFVYDGDEIIADYNTSGGLVAEYVYGGELDEILTMQKGSTVYYYHTDGLGSVTEVTTSTGAFAERYAYTYDAFGKPVIVNASNAVVSNTVIGNRYMFTGREYDSESGTYYFRARNYDPGIGRFLQRDPIGYGDGMNPYAYTSNNPINLVDPYGLTGMWYDRLSGWSHGQTNQAKDALFSTIGGSRSGAYTAATIATVMDFGMGVFDTPSAIGHLGEGTGCFMARPSLENASGMLMDVSLIAGILAGVGSQLNKPYYRYTYEGSKPTYDLRGRINDKTWLSDRKFYSLGDAHNELALPKPPTDVETVKVPWWKYIEGPRPAQSVPGWGRGGAPEYRVGGF